MKLSFRPMPGLTLAVVIALAILISLGTWQYKRLQWKTKLLVEIDAAADAPPFTSLAQVQAALDGGEPVDFRRIGIGAEYAAVDAAPFYVFTPVRRDISWRVFRPVQSGGAAVFAALETVTDAVKAREIEAPQHAAPLRLAGYVRLARYDTPPATDSTPEKNRWFGFNPLPETHDWADSVPGDADMRFYIDTIPGALHAGELPARRPDIRNNHFDYMLTWYGLALTLLVFYILMHRRAGRLSWS